MSLASAKSPKHCTECKFDYYKLFKRIFYIFSTLLSTILLLILIVWLILHPSKPEFSLKEATINQLDLPSQHTLNSSVQFTILSRNPNQRVGIYYGELTAYASYKGQQITVQSSLPPFYQGHGDINILTESLIGSGFPVASSFRYEVQRDKMAGKLVLSLKVNGQVRWKVGSWVSWKYHINVHCIALMDFKEIPSGPLSMKQETQCSTSV
ncbi:unnamed protein product [Rhodiola kirilowii]